ncbi:MAG TPA: hypothetical protein VJU81_15665 [Methylomirabilota bacterium]|nr:hypothetical protein [Methylomirabilota bacterium]
MALLGGAVLAIWNDIAPGGDAEFDHWHISEHIPERVGVPGFLRGRRYNAVTGSPRYFTLYETETVATLQSAPYLARLNAPTPWTTKCIQLFRNNRRTACRTTLSLGAGEGGALATLELGPRSDGEATLRSWLTVTALPAVAARPGIVGAHLAEADVQMTVVRTAEKKLLDAPDTLARWVVMVEGVTAEAVERVCADLLDAEHLTRHGAAGDGSLAVYRLVFSLRR